MGLPYDDARIQEIKDLIRDRTWQSNYEESHALRAACDLLENFESQAAEIARLNRVVEEATKHMGVYSDYIYIKDSAGFTYGLERDAPDLYAELLKRGEQNG